MKYINHNGEKKETPKTATHYSEHLNGNINQFYRFKNGFWQYFSIFGQWKKSSLKK